MKLNLTDDDDENSEVDELDSPPPPIGITTPPVLPIDSVSVIAPLQYKILFHFFKNRFQ